MHESIIPANTKKATLFLGFMRGIDMLILGIGTMITIGLLTVASTSNTWITMAECIPMLFCGLLIIPIPNYHNTLCCLESIVTYNNSRRNYVWKGWCNRGDNK